MIGRITQGLLSRYRRWHLRLRGAQIHGPLWLRQIDVPRLAHRLSLAAGVELDRGVTLIISGPPTDPVAIHIGRKVYINRHTIIDASQSVQIGNDCMIGPFCYITDHDHTTGEDGSFARGRLISQPVIILPRAWIGAHVTILKGVTIGEGAVIGAGSVVTRDVPANAVFVGNPARQLR